jgi:thiosulfate dehydrogenase
VEEFRENFGEKAADSSGFEVPRLADLLARPNAAQLIRGVRLLLETKALLPKNVGNALNCSCCHLEAGTVPLASPFTGVLASFPGYSPRAGRIITIEERINGCFLRSMNGRPLPVDSPDMRAMVAYFTWLKPEARSPGNGAGRGVGKIGMSLRPDIQNGKKVYLAQCTACHGKEGEGLPDARSRYVYPPLWGKNAFNLGAGLARTYTAAAFTKNNMPIGVRENFPLAQGGLSDQEAVDVADYFSHQPRPDFPMKSNDWPKGGKPVDSRY